MCISELDIVFKNKSTKWNFSFVRKEDGTWTGTAVAIEMGIRIPVLDMMIPAWAAVIWNKTISVE